MNGDGEICGCDDCSADDDWCWCGECDDIDWPDEATDTTPVVTISVVAGLL